MQAMSYFRLQADGTVLALAGKWKLARIADIDAELAATPIPASPITLDGTRLEKLDTASALALLVRLAKAGATLAALNGFKPNHSRVLELTRAWLAGEATPARRRRRGPLAMLGAAAVKAGWALHCHLEFPSPGARGMSAAAIEVDSLAPRAAEGARRRGAGYVFTAPVEIVR